MLPIVWLIVALLALGGELFSFALYLASFGGAALAAALTALFLPLPFQLAVFAVCSLLLLVGVRPVALRLLPGTAGEGAPQIGPVGRHGVVVQRIDRQGGQIRIGQGEFWSARALEGEPIPLGAEVAVEGTEGLTVLVRPVLPPAAPAALPAAGDLPYGLSPREVEVLRLVAAGLSNGEIAEKLFLSPRTVHHHISHILAKMNVDSRVDAVRLALQSGLAAPEDDVL